jgi:hypothetical protein
MFDSHRPFSSTYAGGLKPLKSGILTNMPMIGGAKQLQHAIFCSGGLQNAKIIFLRLW